MFFKYQILIKLHQTQRDERFVIECRQQIGMGRGILNETHLQSTKASKLTFIIRHLILHVSYYFIHFN